MKNTKKMILTIGVALSILLLVIGIACADDTEIFSEGVINVPPNVLIIFDTSGSMAWQIESQSSTVYDPGLTYSGTYTANAVYYYDEGIWRALRKYQYVCRGWRCRWNDVGQAMLTDIACSGAATTLGDQGEWIGPIQFGNPYTYDCPAGDPGEVRRLRTGNYINFVNSSGAYLQRKADIAKDAVKNLLDIVQEGSVRFGLMRFRGQGTFSNLPLAQQHRGGYLIAPIGSTHQEIRDAVDDMEMWYHGYPEPHYRQNPYNASGPGTSGGTPLAESLAEAGLYFAGGYSWANEPGQEGYPVGGMYTSPIQWRCQKNYVIVVTDGEPSVDDGTGNPTYRGGSNVNIYTYPDYIDGKSIDCSGNTCLPNVARFLYETDIRNTEDLDNPNGASFNAEDFPIQRIMTYAIGFGSECDEDFLRLTTDNEHGRGQTFMADEGSALAEALSGIITEILQNNASFVAPVVPVSKINRVYAGNSLYLGLFRTEERGEWKGNVKKFGINDDGEILDRNGDEADFDLEINKPSSCWAYSVNDGLDVNKGGAGEQLLHQASRNFYTYQRNNIVSNLNHSSNTFDKSNLALTADTLGLDSAATQADIDDLIDFIRAEGVYTPVTGSQRRTWVLGDILHSRPVVLEDGSKKVIFVGANDGFLHCFVDDESSDYEDLSDDTVSEQWCFVPWDLVPDLHKIRDTADHEYFVDGTPVLFRSGSDQLLTFGLRRGGNKYYTLKVGEVTYNSTTKKYTYVTGGYETPQWKWQVPEDILATPLLGESWSRPVVRRIKTGSGENDHAMAIILAGGYDSANQDLDTPAAEDTRGMAIYAVNGSNGTLLSNLKFTKDSSNLSSMTHSIVDLVVFDRNDDGFTDRIYAGDMGGQVFGYKADSANGNWSGRKLFNAGDGSSATSKLKFFYAPDVILQGYNYQDGGSEVYVINDHVYLGSGDREHPNDKTQDDRFYAIKNMDDTTILTETNENFIDVTFYSNGYNDPHGPNFLKSHECKGWYIRLGYELGSKVREGEKVVSSPIIFNGIVFFNTFTPTQDDSSDDLCTMSGGVGTGLLYAVDYLTGEAIEAFNFNKSNDTVDADGNVEVVLDETDRHINISSGILAPPEIIITPKGPVLLVGPDEKFPIPDDRNVNRYFWLSE